MSCGGFRKKELVIVKKMSSNCCFKSSGNRIATREDSCGSLVSTHLQMRAVEAMTPVRVLNPDRGVRNVTKKINCNYSPRHCEGGTPEAISRK